MLSGIRHEHLIIACLVYALLRVLWKQHRRRLEKLWKKVKKGPPRRWRPKSPKDCPACQSGVSLSLPRIRRDVKPWSQIKSTRGRKKTIKTQGFACPNVDCAYFGNRDATLHALVGNGKRGKHKPIQTLRCQACKCSFSSRRNTPLYYLKTAPDRVEMCLWLLAEGVDISVLVRFTGHVDATVTRWLLRAGGHGERLHEVVFVDLQVAYIQVDEMTAPIAGNKRTNWLWLGIDPLTKIIPALHIGSRKTEDAMQFVHQLVCHLAQGCVPAFTSDGLRQYFYALTAHFGHWKYPDKQWKWLVSDVLLYGQLIKRRNKRKSDKRPFTITRMMWGRRWQLFALLLELGFRATIQTAFIERLNLTIRQGVAPLGRRTWSLAKSNEHLLLHVHWWRTYYHFSRAHESLQVRVPGLRRRYRQRTPAMAAGLAHQIWSLGDILRLPVLPEGGAC
jgi:IS1 family transposase/transposase-like protein